MSSDISDKLIRRIKLHTLLALLSAVVVVTSMAGQYVITNVLGAKLSESAALGIYFFAQLPFAIICGVMGVMSLFYGLKNPTWRSGRIATFTLGILMLFIFVLPYLMNALLWLVPGPR